MPLDDLTATNELLSAELPDARYDHVRYLRWLYEENPWGRAYQANVDENGSRIAHYALIPQMYRNPDGPVPGAYSLHAVTRTGAQRKGYFVSLGKKIYADAAADGRRLMTAVPNEKSVVAGVKYLGWRLVGQVPIRVCVPTSLRTRDVETIPCTPTFIDSERFAELTSDLDAHPTRGITGSWTTAALRWRVSRPDTVQTMHVTPELIAFSLRTVQRGVPAAVILKILPRDGRTGPLSARAIIADACRHHRTPVAIYGGINEHVTVRGFEPPKRMRPSPLFWLVQTLQDGEDQNMIELATYEFFDMDAF